MASITLKISSLIIRTLSKPIANQIKAQAREHERFRRICVSFAQTIHRVDMRLRLGLLQNSAQLEKQAAREAAEVAKKRKSQVPTVKTESQLKADEATIAKEKEKALDPPKPRIRPLSEAKAIDTGANFISETFLFMVAGSLIVFESWRSRRKATSRREDVAERLSDLEESERAARQGLITLEKEVLRLRAQLDKIPPKKLQRILPEAIRNVDEEPEEPNPQSLLDKIYSKFQWLRDTTQKQEPQSLGTDTAIQPSTQTSPTLGVTK
ncbi:conserved hypothetical protein [Uncinocarpus reesii 1704]|uniref:OPA3 protein n=1 Tax=Uncinocarpus reesii (strain UAMH 1704) TaxID=336963 RepID=C4JHM8_UNCRE|nr:uncharacterized protein UREG_02714 [Uncinocarpus reesii 1704]EEP77865.1 conserved hypothetical protein [Uncinocarpus reesii 1704]